MSPPINEIKNPEKIELRSPPAILIGIVVKFFETSIALFASSMESSLLPSNIFCFAIFPPELQ